MITYISNLSGKIEAFLNFKNSLGIKYQAPRSILKNLDRYNLNHENESELSKSLVEGWAEYYATRSETQDRKISKVFPDREYFFPGGYGGMYSASAISSNFRNIWLSAGLKRGGKVKPRAYDFRHHFACANIMHWSEEGKDVHAMLPYLMRYMGHSSLESTYYYIHLIPDYFSQYRALTASSADVIPEADAYEV